MGLRIRRTTWGGGRWSAVYSLWTYWYRFLHLIGISSVDHEEVALLSAPLIRLRPAKARHLVVAHTLDPQSPTEPIGIARSETTPLHRTLFLIHFVDGDTDTDLLSSADSQPSRDSGAGHRDRARLATAFPTDTSPRAWVAVDRKTGLLSLTVAKHNAAVFEIHAAAMAHGRGGALVTLQYACETGRYLSTSVLQTSRTRIACTEQRPAGVAFYINAVPLSPALDRSASVTTYPIRAANVPAVESEAACEDRTLSTVLHASREIPVRLQSAAFNWFVALSPGADLAAATKRETGWDSFIIEFDNRTSTARVRDSRGLYLVLNESKTSFTAGLTRESSRGPDAAGRPAEGTIGQADAKSSAPHVEPGTQTERCEHNARARSSTFREASENTSSGKKKRSNHRTAADDLHSHSDERPGDAADSSQREAHLPRAERFLITLVDETDRVTLRSRKGYLSARRGGVITISQETQPGPRETFCMRLAMPSAMDESAPSLRLRHYPKGLREIEASVVVPADAALAYDVLRDYDDFHRFIKDCSHSALVSRNEEDGSLEVEMVQTHSFLVLSISMHMHLRVREDNADHKIYMQFIRGFGVKSYDGVWHAMERSDGRCTVRVRVSSAPSVPAPNFLVDGVMTHAVTATLEQIRTECILRSTASRMNIPTAPSE